MRVVVKLAGLLVVTLLLGCNASNVRDDDQTGDVGKARSVKESPAQIYTSLAIGYMREGRMDVALRKAKQAVNADPNHSNAHNVMALVYQRLGQNQLAEKHFRRSVSLDKRNFYALNAYGTFLCGRKRYADASVQFENAVQNPLNRNSEIALANAGICAYQEGKRTQAESYLRKALSKNPRYAPALSQMGEVSYDLRDYMSARAYMQRYTRVAKHTSKTLWLGIRIENKLGDRNAEASYRMLLKNRFPDSKEILLLREMDQRQWQSTTTLN